MEQPRPNPDDLLAKVRMLKFLSQDIGGCYMRCTGMDAINAVGIEAYNCDKKHGTEYWPRLLEFVKMIQQNDFVVFSGVTDVKGDRSLRPSQQKDPDMYLHVVDRNKDGIVVRGAKIHQTGSMCAHWAIIVPTREMRQDDKDYAVCFAIPNDAKGLIHVYGRGTLEASLCRGVTWATPSSASSRPWSSLKMCSYPGAGYSFAGNMNTQERWCATSATTTATRTADASAAWATYLSAPQQQPRNTAA